MKSVFFVVALIVAGVTADSARGSAVDSSLHDDSKPRALSAEMRGDIYVARKMYLDAVDMYRQTTQTPTILNKIGVAFQLMMQPELARKSYQQAIHLDPELASAVNNIGTTYYEERQYGKAITFYKRSLKLSSRQAYVCANLGAAYFARGDYKKSAAYFDQALRLDPDVLENRGMTGTQLIEQTGGNRALFHLALARKYASLGYQDRALIYLRKALEEGFKERKKIPEMPEFRTLKQNAEFRQLLTENLQPL